MKGPREGGCLPACTSFCQVDAPNVMGLAFKRAEDGAGYILRLIETEGRETKVRVTLPHFRLSPAFEANLVEQNRRLLPCTRHAVEVGIKPFGIATLRLAGQL